MSGWYLLAIPLGGLGAVARVAGTRLGETRLPGGAPVATAVINVIGAGLLGIVAAIGNDVALLVLGSGLLGGFTTFSTWMVEVDSTDRAGRATQALVLVVVPTVLGLAAYLLTRSIS